MGTNSSHELARQARSALDSLFEENPSYEIEFFYLDDVDDVRRLCLLLAPLRDEQKEMNKSLAQVCEVGETTMSRFRFNQIVGSSSLDKICNTIRSIVRSHIQSKAVRNELGLSMDEYMSRAAKLANILRIKKSLLNEDLTRTDKEILRRQLDQHQQYILQLNQLILRRIDEKRRLLIPKSRDTSLSQISSVSNHENKQEDN